MVFSFPHAVDEYETASVVSHASCDSDDFVVVIPDCFNLDVPLKGYVPLHLRKEEEEETHDSHMTLHANLEDQGDDSDLEIIEDPFVRSSRPQGGEEVITEQPSLDGIPRPKSPTSTTKPAPTSELPAQNYPPGSSKTASSFVPERITLKNVRDARIRNPLTLATGLVNSFSDLMQEHLHFGGSKKQPQLQFEETKEDEEGDKSEEDIFEVSYCQ